jgi:hypothetical protein
MAVPEFKCTFRADERSRMFQAGYRFPELMSYQELCQFVSKESNKAGFDPLRPRVDVNDAMRSRIALLAQNNVSVASIQTSLLQEFNVMLSDFQVMF